MARTTIDKVTTKRCLTNKSVRKNVTLPEWLNEEAEALKINFSQVLQEALLQKLEEFEDLGNKKV